MTADDTQYDAVAEELKRIGKDELLSRIDRAWAALQKDIGALPDEQITARGPERWSVKDHVAHIAGWEQMMAAQVRDWRARDTSGTPAATFASIDTDTVNARLYESRAKMSLTDVRELAGRAHDGAIEAIRTIDERRLHEPFWDDDPERRPATEKIAGDTYLHYLEHLIWIRVLVATL